MPEALTESFCERCGTRYEFQAPTELNPLRKTRGLVAGLKNYIMSQDALGDAIGDAMRSEEQALASQQLEAFHNAFNFCIDCRQYACTNCWNDAAGRCRSCAPIQGKDDLADRLEAAYLADHAAMHAGEPQLAVDEISRRLGTEAWPQSDLPEEEAAPVAPAWPEPLPAEPVIADAGAGLEREPEPLVTAEAEREELPEESMGVARVLAWEDDAEVVLRSPIEEALPEPESIFATATEPEPEPMVATEPEPESIFAKATEPEPEPQVDAEPEPEPQVDAEPEPEPQVAAEPEPEPQVASTPRPTAPRPIRPIAETILRPPPQVVQPTAPVDEDAVAARRAQMDILGLEDPGIGRVAAERPIVLPYRSSGAALSASELIHRTVGESTALWDASAREVAAARSAIAVQSCGSCGLSLSASARFCRRCGTRQARSA
jgi:hypothetical protein